MEKTIRTLFCLILILFFVRKSFAIPKQNTRQYSVSNYEIMETVKQIDKNVRDLENKLSRHEFREAQVADFSTKTLNALNSDHAFNQKNMKSVARQLAKLEDKLLSLDALVQVTDERQRDMLGKMNEGLNRLLMMRPDVPALPPSALLPNEGGTEREVKKVLRRMNGIDETMMSGMKAINNEIKIVGESLSQHMEMLTSRHDRLWNDWTTCNNDHIRAMTEATLTLSQTGALFKERIAEGDLSGGNCNPLNEDVVDKLETLDKVYQDQERELAELNRNTNIVLQEHTKELDILMKETQIEKGIIEHAFDNIIGQFHNLTNHSYDKLNRIETSFKTIVLEASQQLSSSIENVASLVKSKSDTILNTLDDTASMSENIHDSMTQNFEDLTKDIRSLKKVEQVMLNTADAVLDTKRSIEFGIQQVILELSDAVQVSGKKINSTLSDQINSISFAILKNQSTALTNMTKKLENEISQVWRQIGIMYQQVAQSVDILDDLQSTTAQQMNASLDKVGTMDGTVGAINNKVIDVEDNLNYLLGRLSLVTSEFSQMKTGVGAELDKLRNMTKAFSNKDIVEYTVNKRSLPHKLDSQKDQILEQ